MLFSRNAANRVVLFDMKAEGGPKRYEVTAATAREALKHPSNGDKHHYVTAEEKALLDMQAAQRTSESGQKEGDEGDSDEGDDPAEPSRTTAPRPRRRKI